MDLFNYQTPLKETIAKIIIDYHTHESQAIHARELASLVYNMGYEKPSEADIYAVIKNIREEGMPNFNFIIMSKAGSDGGFWAKYKGSSTTKSAQLKQWLGLTKSLMKQGVITKAYYYQVLNELDTEHLSKGQIDLTGNVFECEVKQPHA